MGEARSANGFTFLRVDNAGHMVRLPTEAKRPYAQVDGIVCRKWTISFVREGTARQTEECAGNVEHVPLQRPLLLSKARSSDSYSGALRFDLATSVALVALPDGQVLQSARA